MGKDSRNDELARIALEWFKLSKKDRQWAINILLSRNLVYFDDQFNLKLGKGP